MTEVSKKACVFCGATGQGVKITKEHVLPGWLKTSVNIEFVQGIETIRRGGEPLGKPRIAPPFTRQARIACLVCNTGWMRDLEERARPVLLPMLNGVPVSLDEQAQQAVATWGAKTSFALLKARTDTQSEVPTEHYRQLANAAGDVPPTGVAVWLAKDAEKRSTAPPALHITAFSSRVKTIDAGEDSVVFYGLMLRLHRLVIQVIGPSDPNLVADLSHELSESYVCQIWPATGRAVTWPPPGDLAEVGGFDALAGRT
jgi:hypothetical protein